MVSDANVAMISSVSSAAEVGLQCDSDENAGRRINWLGMLALLYSFCSRTVIRR